MFFRQPRHLFRLEFARLLLGGIAQHTQPRDIDEGEYARLGTIDHEVAESFEFAPARAAGVDHSGDSGAKTEAVWLNAQIAGPRSGHAGGMEQVRMNVNDSRRNVKTVNIDQFFGLRCVDVRAQRRLSCRQR